MKISVILKQKPEFVIPNTLCVINLVILSVSEVSINKAYLKFFGFFATLKMTKSAVSAKTARNDKRKKPKNKAFKKFKKTKYPKKCLLQVKR